VVESYNQLEVVGGRRRRWWGWFGHHLERAHGQRGVDVDMASRHAHQPTPDSSAMLFSLLRAEQEVQNRQVLFERAQLHHAVVLPVHKRPRSSDERPHRQPLGVSLLGGQQDVKD